MEVYNLEHSLLCRIKPRALGVGHLGKIYIKSIGHSNIIMAFHYLGDHGPSPTASATVSLRVLGMCTRLQFAGLSSHGLE